MAKQKTIIKLYSSANPYGKTLDVINYDVTIIIINNHHIRVIKHIDANNQPTVEYKGSEDERISIQNWGK